jgi:hypothetical protein
MCCNLIHTWINQEKTNLILHCIFELEKKYDNLAQYHECDSQIAEYVK